MGSGKTSWRWRPLSWILKADRGWGEGKALEFGEPCEQACRGEKRGWHDAGTGAESWDMLCGCEQAGVGLAWANLAWLQLPSHLNSGASLRGDAPGAAEETTTCTGTSTNRDARGLVNKVGGGPGGPRVFFPPCPPPPRQLRELGTVQVLAGRGQNLVAPSHSRLAPKRMLQQSKACALEPEDSRGCLGEVTFL